MSRFITYPSIVEKDNHTVILVDPSSEDQKRLELYLQINFRDYDVYIYQGSVDDLQWLKHVAEQADTVLINNQSQIEVANSVNVIRYGSSTSLVDHLAYFEQISLDKPDEYVV